MTCGWASALALIGAALAMPPRASAQRVLELGAHGVATGSTPELAAAGVYGALRPATRARIAATLAFGASGGELAWRGEALAHFLLSPSARSAVGFYGGGGLAVVEGARDRRWLVLLLGVESSPGGRRGWSAELGVGGGVRLALGYRWRWWPPGWAS